MQKFLKLAQKRVLVQFLRVGFRGSQRRACHALSYNRSSIRYQSRREPQQALRIRLRDLAGARVHYGYRRLHLLLRPEGWMINAPPKGHPGLRLYKLEGLSLRLKKTRKRISRLRVVPPRAQVPMNVGAWILSVTAWPMDAAFGS